MKKKAMGVVLGLAIGVSTILGGCSSSKEVSTNYVEEKANQKENRMYTTVETELSSEKDLMKLGKGDLWKRYANKNYDSVLVNVKNGDKHIASIFLGYTQRGQAQSGITNGALVKVDMN